MIFPEISLQDWLKKYPDLRVGKSLCDGCGKEIRTTIPFIEHDYVGLKAPPCCDRQRHTAMKMLTRTERAHKRWSSIL